MYWELWHCKSSNMITDFGTLEEGLAFVADELEAGGEAAVVEWQLLASEIGVPPIEGEDLVLTAAATRTSMPADLQPSQALAERLAQRIQGYKQRVRQLEKQIAVMKAEQATPAETAATGQPRST